MSSLNISSGSVVKIKAIIGKIISDIKKKKHAKNTDNF
jgi:hypothetical protein